MPIFPSIISGGALWIGAPAEGTSGQAFTTDGAGNVVLADVGGGTTINNNANNRIITGSDTVDTLEGESTLTYDASTFTINCTDTLVFTRLGVNIIEYTAAAVRCPTDNFKTLGSVSNRWKDFYSVAGRFGIGLNPTATLESYPPGDTTPGLIVNNPNTTTAVVADFRIGGLSRVQVNSSGGVIVSGAAGGSTDLQEWNPNGVTAGTRATIDSDGNFSHARVTESEQFGANSSASGTQSTAVGNLAIASGSSSVAIGKSSSASGSSSFAIGASSLANALDSMAFAAGAQATATGAIVMGRNSSAGGVNAVSIGKSVTNTQAGGIAIGAGCQLFNINVASIGGNDAPIDVLHVGNGDFSFSTPHASGIAGTGGIISTPASFFVRGGSGLIGNLNGGALYLYGGLKSGTGVNGTTHLGYSGTAVVGTVKFSNAFTFPTTDGTSGQVLQTNGAGTVTWVTPTAGLTATGTPVDNQVAVWTSASSLEGDANFTWDGSLLDVTGSFQATDSTFPVIKAIRTTVVGNAVRSAIGVKLISSVNMSDGFGAGFTFAIEDDTSGEQNIASVYGEREGADNTGALSFSTYVSGSVQHNRLRIMSEGAIGVSNASPEAFVHIVTTNASSYDGVIRIDNTGIGAGLVANRTDGAASLLSSTATSSNFAFNNDGSNYFSIASLPKTTLLTGSLSGLTRHVAVLSSGEFGIGTNHTSPTATLDVVALDTTTVGLLVDTPASYATDVAQFKINGSTKLVLDSAGNVGIGQSSPTALLHLAAGTASNPPIKLTSGTNSEETGALEFDGDALYFTPGPDARSVQLADGIITSSTTVANTVTETTLFTEAVSASAYHVGQVIICHLFGYYSTANGTDAFTLRLKVAGTTIDSVVSAGGVVTNAPWQAKFTFTVRSVGVSGTVIAWTDAVFDNTHDDQADTSTTTIDTTAAANVLATLQWDNADVGNTATVTQAYCEIIG